jgi:hypothetical protein
LKKALEPKAKLSSKEIFEDSKKITTADVGSGCFRMDEIFGYSKETESFLGLLPDNIGTTVNLHQVVRKGFSPITRYAQPFVFTLRIHEGSNDTFIALNHEDAKNLTDSEVPPTGKASLSIIDIHTGFALPLGNAKISPEDERTLQARTLLKMSSGNLRLTLREQLAFLHWISSQDEQTRIKTAQWIDCLRAIYPQAEESKEVVLDILKDGGVALLKKVENGCSVAAQ